MSWARDELEDQMIMDQIDYDERQMQLQEAEECFDMLDTVPDVTFLDYVLINGNKSDMNTVVKGGKFKAYDIAYRLRDKGIRPTKKQRTAIMNVFVFSQTGVRRDAIKNR